jgi:hypothetical protein
MLWACFNFSNQISADGLIALFQNKIDFVGTINAHPGGSRKGRPTAAK